MFSALFHTASHPPPTLNWFPFHHAPSKSSPAKPSSSWRPFILKRSIGWVSLLTALVISFSLEVYHQISAASTGFVVPTAGPRFLATYSPVVFAVLIGWTWQVLDIEVKKLAPWVALASQECTASESLFLDYMDTNVLMVIWHASRRRHFHTLMTSLGVLITAAIGVASTSLWVVATVRRSTSTSFKTTAVFNGSLWNSSSSDITFFQPFQGVQAYNLSMPKWVYADYAIEPFNVSTPAFGADATMTGITSGVRGDLECQAGFATLAPYTDVADGYHLLGSGEHTYRLAQLEIDLDGCRQTVNASSYVDIGTTVARLNGDGIPLVGDTEWLATGIHEMSCHDSLITVLVYAQFIGTELRNTTILGCRPYFERIVAQVTVNATTGHVVDFLPQGTAEPITFPDSGRALSWIDHILADYATHRATGNRNPVSGDFNIIYPRYLRYTYRPWFYLLSELYKLTPGQFLDVDVLQATTRTVFGDVWRMVASTSMFSPADLPTSGILDTKDERLVEQVVATRILQIAFLILGVIHLIVCIRHDTSNLPRDPSVLAYLASILASNLHLNHLLESTGALTMAQVNDYLSHTSFKSVSHSDGRLGIETRSKITPKFETSVDVPEIWYPFMLQSGQGMLIALLAIFMVTVEILLHIDHTNDGLFDSSSSTLMRDVQTYVMAAIVFGVGAGIQAFDGGARAVTVLHTFSSTTSPAIRFSTYTPLHQPLLTMFHHAFTHRQYICLGSTLGVGLVPLLKLITAGFFISHSYASSTPRSIHVTDGFNDTMPNSLASIDIGPGNHAPVGPVFAMVHSPSFRQSKPSWTTSQFAVARVDTLGFQSGGTQYTLSAHIPVFYPEVTCVDRPPSTYNLSGDHMGGPFIGIDCGQDYYDASALNPFYRASFVMRVSIPNAPFAYTRPACMSDSLFTFVYGRTVDRDESNFNSLPPEDRVGRLTMVECRGQMIRSKMDVIVRVQGNSTEVLHVNTMTETDREVTRFFNQDNDAHAMGPDLIPSKDLDLLDITPKGSNFGPFFQLLAVDIGVTYDELVNQDSLNEPVADLYRAYWVQFVNAYSRVPAPSLLVQSVVSYPVTRVGVDRTSARGLQVLLGVIMVLILITGWSLRHAKPLPRPPFSLGAQLSLMAGSKMVGLLALKSSRVQLLTDAQYREELDGYHIKLGWSRMLDGRRWYGIDFEGADEELQRIDTARSKASQRSLLPCLLRWLQFLRRPRPSFDQV